MPKKVKYCANHPDIVAGDVCTECGKSLCYNCKIESFNHVFCSMHCLFLYITKETAKGLFFLIKGVFVALFWPFRVLPRLSRRGWAEFVLCLGLIVCFVLIWRLGREVAFLETGMQRGKAQADYVDTSQVSPPVIFEPAEGGMVHSSTLDVVGEANVDHMVSLSIDGRLVRVELPDRGKFKFENVRLHRGQNRLEVRAHTEDGRVSTLQRLIVTYANPTLSYLSRDLNRGALTRREIALTFDGGSIDNAADEILDYLKEKGAACTFFLTGNFIRRYPQTVKRIVAEGHEVGNHTWSHPHLTTFAENRRHRTLEQITAEKMEQELSRASSLFQVVSNSKMVGLWRAPFGEYNAEILRWAAVAGYKHVGWTIGQGSEETMDTMDWVADKDSKAYRSADEIAERILNFADKKSNGANGAIILMHLGTHRKDDFPHKKLPEIIDGLRERGYELVKVTEMLSEG